jgi:hypothetical protein
MWIILEIKEFGLGLNFGFTAVGISLERAVPIGRKWGWGLRQLPGRRYTKLLMRMHLAAHEYRQLDRHLFTLWKNASTPFSRRSD